MAFADKSSSHDDAQNEETYEYPDPEIIERSLWPVRTSFLDSSIDGLNSNAISATRRRDDETDDPDDQQSLASHIVSAHSNLEIEGPDTDYQTDIPASPSSESDLDSDPAPPVRTGRRGRPRGSRGRPRKTLPTEDRADHPRNHKRRKPETAKKGDKIIIKRGFRKPLPASKKFSELQSEATKAFIQGDYDSAEKLANAAIVENPEQFTAHSLLSEIFFERGDIDRAVDALFAGAHVNSRVPEVWERSAEMILERTNDLQDVSLLQKAIFCYGRVLSLESDRAHIRIARSRLYREVGQISKAFADVLYVLKRSPTDTELMKMAIELAVENKSIKEAIDLCEKRIGLLQKECPQLPISFDWTDLYIYSGLLVQLGSPAENLAKLKRVTRWVCGRGTDDYWEYQTQNDCEFDVNPEPRRIKVLEFKESGHDHSQYGAGLPLEIRVHFGILRLQSDNTKEAIMHFRFLMPTDRDTTLAKDFPDLFQLIGELYVKKRLFARALSFLEPLREIQDIADPAYYAHMADCYRHEGRIEEAETCYKELMKHDEYDRKARKDMAEMFHAAKKFEREAALKSQIANEAAHQKKRKYRSMYDTQGRDDRAAIMGTGQETTNDAVAETENVINSPSQVVSTELVTASIEGEELLSRKRQRRQNHRTKAAKSADQEDLQEAFLQLADFDEILEIGDTEAEESWIESARGLIRIFREARVFYPHDRSVKFYGYTAEAQAKSLRSKAKQHEIDVELAAKLGVPIDQLPEDNIPDEFCYVPFEDWLDLFLRLAFILSRNGKRQDCYVILELARTCNVFYNDKDYMRQIYLSSALCAFYLDDDEKIGSVARYFVANYQFNTDSYRLYPALFRICSRPNNGAFNMSILQKFVLRQLRGTDNSLTKSGDVEDSMSEDQAELSDGEIAKSSATPTRLDVALLLLYGQMLSASGSYIFAMNYLYRARSLDPTNPLINLSLGLAYIHHALKRQGLNRHQLIMQGLVFVFQYHDARIQSDIIAEQQEATFNVGRTFHLLGLVHLAIPRYEKVLQLAEKLRTQSATTSQTTADDENHEDFAVDAAFALQGLYAFGGNMVKAKEIVDKWMVL